MAVNKYRYYCIQEATFLTTDFSPAPPTICINSPLHQINLDSISVDPATIPTTSNYSNLVSSYTGTFNNLTTQSFTGTNIYIQNITGNTGTFNNLSIQNISGNIGSINNFSIQNISGNTGILNYISCTNITGSYGFFRDASIRSLTGNTGSFANLIINGGNISLINNSTTLTSSSSELVLEETGDAFGSCRLRLRNRNGTNGAIIENSSLDLVDLIFNPSSNLQQNIRYEHRNASMFAPTNTSGEFELGFPGDPNLIIGDTVTSIRKGNFGVGVTTPLANLHVAGTTMFSGNFGNILFNPSSIISSQTYNWMPVSGSTGSQVLDNVAGNLSWQPRVKYVILRDEKTAGTNGGSSVANTWVTRVLNVLDTNIPAVTLITNQLSLPAGKYKIYITCPARNTNAHQCRLYNVSDQSIALYGTVSIGQAFSSNIVTYSTIIGTIQISSSKLFSIQHITETSVTSSGLGIAGGFGIEVYTMGEIICIF